MQPLVRTEPIPFLGPPPTPLPRQREHNPQASSGLSAKDRVCGAHQPPDGGVSHGPHPPWEEANHRLALHPDCSKGKKIMSVSSEGMCVGGWDMCV